MIAQLLVAASLFAAPALAQDKPQSAPASDGPPKRVRSILLYGDQQCPKTTDPNEIVVCSTSADSPYRIPKQFRDKPEEGPKGQAWSQRMNSVMDDSKAGLPGSCSPIGTAAQTGCTMKMLQQYAAEKAAKKREASQVP
jgi:hypothetical protein